MSGFMDRVKLLIETNELKELDFITHAKWDSGPYKLCWQREYRCFAYGWDDEKKTGITMNSVSLSFHFRGYWIGVSKP